MEVLSQVIYWLLIIAGASVIISIVWTLTAWVTVHIYFRHRPTTHGLTLESLLDSAPRISKAEALSGHSLTHIRQRLDALEREPSNPVEMADLILATITHAAAHEAPLVEAIKLKRSAAARDT